jgi:hypothetical protein
MNKKLLGLGFGVALSTLGVAAIPAVASADATCYTGCSSGGGGNPPPPSTPVFVQATPPSNPASGGLAFTGADISEMAAAGAGAVLVGGALVRRSRRQRRATA